MNPVIVVSVLVAGTIIAGVSVPVRRRLLQRDRGRSVQQMIAGQGTTSYITGRVIGKYKILEQIGTGHTWLVYLCMQIDDPSGRLIVRLLRPEITDESFRNRLKERLQALCKVDHPDIVRPLEWSEDEERFYVVQPYCLGNTLRSIMEEGPCPIPTAGRMVASLMDAVRIHASMGVPLKRLDPDSVIVGDKNTISVVDLGVHRARTGSLVGMRTVVGGLQAVLPPMDVGERADQLGVGYLLWELLAGRRPFQHHDLVTEVNRIGRADPQPLAEFNNKIPQPVSDVVARMTKADPAQRYPDLPQARAAWLAAVAAAGEDSAKK